VVKKTIRDIGSAQFPVLTRTNYGEWEVVMKVMLKARGLWKAISFGTDDEEEDHLAMEAILKAVPAEYRVTLGSKDSAKEAWDALKTMRLGNERARKAKAQLARREYDSLDFLDGESVEDFALRLTGMVTQLGALGEPVTEEEEVRKFLRTAPKKFDQIVMSIETCLEMEALTIEDVTGRLKAVEERIAGRAAAKVAAAGSSSAKLHLTQEERATRAAAGAGGGAKLYLTREEWEARAQKMAAGAGSSAPPRAAAAARSRSGRGRRRVARLPQPTPASTAA
jgi:hypothetical protein